MIKRRAVGKPAQITFTSDFHELVTGDLRPGHPVILSYDPKRIVPKGEPYLFGDPARPIVAFVRFHDDEPPIQVKLHSRSGIILHPDEDVTGQGSMLKARLAVPISADLVSVWFSYLSASGAVYYDSDFGRNFNFSFPGRDIAVLSATVEGDSPRPSIFSVSVAAVQAVTAVSVRFHFVSDLKAKGHEISLGNSGKSDEQGRLIWSVDGIAIPYGAILRFEVFYWIGAHRFKDDNSGHYYLAPQPKPEHVPPPPPELTNAARAWR